MSCWFDSYLTMNSQNISVVEEGPESFIFEAVDLKNEKDHVNFGEKTENNTSSATVEI